MIGHISELQREVMWEPKLCYISYVQLSIISLPCPLSKFLGSDLTSTHHIGIAKKMSPYLALLPCHPLWWQWQCTGLRNNTCTWLRECCRQVEAECGKQQQEQTSPNHIQVLFPGPVVWCGPFPHFCSLWRGINFFLCRCALGGRESKEDRAEILGLQFANLSESTSNLSPSFHSLLTGKSKMV